MGLGQIARELAQALALTLLVFLTIRSFVQNFRVDGTSMEPGLQAGQILLISKAPYFHTDGTLLEGLLPGTTQGSVEYPFGGPRRGDVVVFSAPVERNTSYIKRIIGLPGDAVLIRNGDVFVNGQGLSEPYVHRPFPATYSYPGDGAPVMVPDGSYFVLGDNRPDSFDSHYGWFVPVESFLGKAWLSYWPRPTWGFVEHVPLVAAPSSTELFDPPVPARTVAASAPTTIARIPPGARLAPPMASPRAGHTATLLQNGDILVAGGRDEAGSLATAELYDTAVNRWTSAGVANIPRSEHTATRLMDGRVLLVGGRKGDSTILDAAELYDPVTDAWTPAGSMSAPRAQHSAELLEDGRVLIAGGYNGDGFLTSVEMYDPASNRFSIAAPSIAIHSGNTTTRLPGGEIFVVGGFGTRSQAESERYSLDANGWTRAGSLRAGRSGHTGTLLSNGKVLVAGGLSSVGGGTYLDSAEVYDPIGGTWTGAASMARRRSGHTATLLRDGDVLLVGGKSGEQLVANAERYAASLNAWGPAGQLATPRWLHTATLLPSGRVLIIGGRDGAGDTLDSVEQYDPPTNSWVAAR